jgi:hypothetical protein
MERREFKSDGKRIIKESSGQDVLSSLDPGVSVDVEEGSEEDAK